MGRHLAVLTAVVAVFVSGCGLRPAEAPLADSDGECPPADRRDPAELEVGVIVEALAASPHALKYAAPELQADAELVKLAVAQNPCALYVSTWTWIRERRNEDPTLSQVFNSSKDVSAWAAFYEEAIDAGSLPDSLPH